MLTHLHQELSSRLTSAQKLAQDTEMVLPWNPSEGLPKRPILENTRLIICVLSMIISSIFAAKAPL